ncbi:DUF1748-domain-containing protein [Pholiota molesta]|nr:DUF1748-domain-containing protein [Pholiota molesta]
MLGKLVHLGFDALLITAFLAGVKRTTGLTRLTIDLLNSYLEFGEYAFDFAVVIFGVAILSFERKRQ